MKSRDIKLINEAYQQLDDKFNYLVCVYLDISKAYLAIDRGTAPLNSKHIVTYIVYHPGGYEDAAWDTHFTSGIDQSFRKKGITVDPLDWWNMVHDKIVNTNVNADNDSLTNDPAEKKRALDAFEKLKAEFKSGEWKYVVDSNNRTTFSTRLLGRVDTEYTTAKQELETTVGDEDLLGIKDLFKNL